MWKIMKARLIRTYDKLDSLRFKLPRRVFARQTLKIKKKSLKIKPLSSQEKRVVADFWGKVKVNTDYISLYNRHNETFDPRYIPNNIYFAEVDTHFNSARATKAIDDKNLYDFYFHDVRCPKTILRKIEGSYLDATHQIISFNEVIEKCFAQKEIIVIKATNSNSGRGILFWSFDDGVEALKSILYSPNNYIVQEIIKQHPAIGSLHQSSINTLRIVTLYYKENVHVLSSVVRMGVDGSRVDNTPYSSMFCGINSDGSLKKYAYNMNGYRFDKHPNSTVFSEVKIPDFNSCIAFVKKLSPRFIRVSKLTSWDVAIGEDGLPILIEVNLSYGQLDYHQYTNGPIFGNLTEEVINEVFGK